MEYMETLQLNAQEIKQLIKRKSLAISSNQNLELMMINW